MEAKPISPTQQEEIVQVKEEVNQLAELFDEAKLKNILLDMVEQYKANHKNLEVTVLKQPYKLEGEKITFLLNGDIQQDIFIKNRPEVLNTLRRKLNNYNISIHCLIQEEAVSGGKKLYTSSDKLNYLLEKHAALGELQKKFGLKKDF